MVEVELCGGAVLPSLAIELAGGSFTRSVCIRNRPTGTEIEQAGSLIPLGKSERGCRQAGLV